MVTKLILQTEGIQDLIIVLLAFCMLFFIFVSVRTLLQVDVSTQQDSDQTLLMVDGICNVTHCCSYIIIHVNAVIKKELAKQKSRMTL